MEFNFDVKYYLKNEITTIESGLIPDGFSGDRREFQECVSRMSLLITALGENSAQAQGLQRIITSGERLRNSDHTIYLLTEPEGGSRKGIVLGMLKVGPKHLYVFDGKGNSHEVSAMCVLDFYVHETKQRTGLGKKLFDFMLNDKAVLPEHLAVDKPSPKFLSFLNKHYGLETIIPQMNNFVLYEGFFNNRPDGDRREFKDVKAAGISSSVLRSLSGGHERTQVFEASSRTPKATLNSTMASPFGRHAAHRPASTMGMILQQHSVGHPPSPGSRGSNSAEAESSEPEALESALEDLQLEPDQEVPADGLPEEEAPPAVEEQVEEPEPVEKAPLPCKVQAAHLDLKFYHSSLW